ncbi:MAG: energy transducer TonB [Sulfuriferula sp.]|nr:energy transducer TonB [Sulfuriferula sp.]
MALSATPFVISVLLANRAAVGRLLVVILLHLGLLYALLHLATQPTIAATPHVISVTLAQPVVDIPEPKITPPKLVTPTPQKITPSPVLAAKRPITPTAVVAPMPEPAQPQPVTPAAPPSEPAPIAAPAPPIAAPRVDANYLDNPKPPYPAVSRQLGEEGKVLLRVYVNTDGTVAKLELHRSSGYERLDNVALNTVPQWKFIPAQQGNLAVAAWVIVPISFNLRNR